MTFFLSPIEAVRLVDVIFRLDFFKSSQKNKKIKNVKIAYKVLKERVMLDVS